VTIKLAGCDYVGVSIINVIASPRFALTVPLDSIKLLSCLRVVLRVLSSNRQTHSVSFSNITPNHPLMSDILPHLPFQL
jgi:hypothetical protein